MTLNTLLSFGIKCLTTKFTIGSKNWMPTNLWRCSSWGLQTYPQEWRISLLHILHFIFVFTKIRSRIMVIIWLQISTKTFQTGIATLPISIRNYLIDCINHLGWNGTVLPRYGMYSGTKPSVWYLTCCFVTVESWLIHVSSAIITSLPGKWRQVTVSFDSRGSK